MIIVEQDKKTIINFDDVTKIYINNPLETYNGEFRIKAENAWTTEILGYYKTEERAKEVLEEIISTYQIVMTKNDRYGKELDKIEQFNTVYEMPKE